MKIISLMLIFGISKHFSIPNSSVTVVIIVSKLPCIYPFSILRIIPMREINKISSKRIRINRLTLYSCNEFGNLTNVIRRLSPAPTYPLTLSILPIFKFKQFVTAWWLLIESDNSSLANIINILHTNTKIYYYNYIALLRDINIVLIIIRYFLCFIIYLLEIKIQPTFWEFPSKKKKKGFFKD